MNASILLTSFQEFSFFSVLLDLISSIGSVCAFFIVPVFIVYALFLILIVIIANVIKTIDVYYNVPRFLKGSNICLNQFGSYPGISIPLMYSSSLALYSALNPDMAISIVDSSSTLLDEELQEMIISLKDQWKGARLTEEEIRRKIMTIHVDLLWDKVEYFTRVIASFVLRIFTIISLAIHSLYN
jgi:hypothetical protein